MFFTFGLKEYGRNNEVVLYKRGGRKAGFHCIRKREDPGDEDDVIEGAD